MLAARIANGDRACYSPMLISWLVIRARFNVSARMIDKKLPRTIISTGYRFL
jgi:hypothetical protein